MKTLTLQVQRTTIQTGEITIEVEDDFKVEPEMSNLLNVWCEEESFGVDDSGWEDFDAEDYQVTGYHLSGVKS